MTAVSERLDSSRESLGEERVIRRPVRLATCINSMAISGGSELNTVRTAELLSRREGYDVMAVTLTDDRSGMYARYSRSGIPVHGFPVDSLVGWQAAAQIRRMARLFRREAVDLVHTNDCYTNFLVVLAARLARIPVIASKRYIRPFEPQHKYTDLVSFALANLVLANSEAVAETVHDVEHVSRSRIRVVPNFVDDEAFSTAPLRASLRSQLGIPTNAVVFCIVAQLRPEKNHRLLLEAFRPLAEESHNAYLLIVGSGSEEANIVSHVQELGLEKRVTLTGHMDSAFRVFAAADVALLPSQHEGFPNSIVEAMAAGLPVIATRVGGIPDAVDHETTGILVTPDSLHELRQAMVRFCTDSSFRLAAGLAGRRKAEREFCADAVLTRLESVYADALAGRI